MNQDTRELLVNLHNLLRQAEALLYDYLTVRGVKIPPYPETLDATHAKQVQVETYIQQQLPDAEYQYSHADAKALCERILKQDKSKITHIRQLLDEFNVAKLSLLDGKDLQNFYVKLVEVTK